MNNELIDALNLDDELSNRLTRLFEECEDRIKILAQRCKTNGFSVLIKENDLMRLAVCTEYLKFTYDLYKGKGISDDIFKHTISDIKIWCENNDNKGLKNYD